MRRISLIDRPIGLFRRQRNLRSSSPYLCLACKVHTTSFSTASPRAAPSNEKIPYTEKIRRRIWGTNNPPGLEDPYGDASAFDKTKKRPREAHEQETEASARGQGSQEPPTEVEESAADNGVTLVGKKKKRPIEVLRATEAKSWKGLRWVGRDPVWEPEEDFEGFAPADAVTDADQITAALHRAIVEVFAMKQAVKPLHGLSTVFSAVGLQDDDWTNHVQITPSPSGATIQVPEDTSLQQVMDSLAATAMDDGDVEVEQIEFQADVVADRSEVEPLKPGAISSTDSASAQPETIAPEMGIDADRSSENPLVDASTLQTIISPNVISSWDPSWLQISLENPEVKFAVLKRILQLTGIRFPDAAIKSSNTAKALLNVLITPPKPRKLADALEQNHDLLQLDNVSIHRGRRSFYDRERDIGRLKVIEKELKARGLSL